LECLDKEILKLKDQLSKVKQSASHEYTVTTMKMGPGV